MMVILNLMMSSHATPITTLIVHVKVLTLSLFLYSTKIIVKCSSPINFAISWIAKLTATHDSGYTTTLTAKGSSTVEILEEDAYDALWEDFYDTYKEIDDYDNPHEKALIKHIINSKVIDDTKLPDWTIKINVYAT